MKSIVTGGCGFIGSHIVDRLLDEGHNVVVIDNCSTGRLENLAHHQGNAHLTIVEADICEYETIAPLFEGTDWVFHMAALADIVPSIQKPQEYFHSNVDGTFSVLQAAKAGDVKRFLYTASSSCYGIPDHFPTDEQAEIRPEYPYALTKQLGEELALHWAKVYQLPVVSLCLFNVYGPRSRTSGTYGAVFGVFLGQSWRENRIQSLVQESRRVISPMWRISLTPSSRQRSRMSSASASMSAVSIPIRSIDWSNSSAGRMPKWCTSRNVPESRIAPGQIQRRSTRYSIGIRR